MLNKIALFAIMQAVFIRELQGGSMNISSHKLGLLGTCLIVLTLAVPSMAQNRTIKGKVTDDKGQAISGATIVIQPIDGRAHSYNTKTDKKGNYVYMGIAAGEYYVVARAKGYQPAYKPVRPTISNENMVDLQLSPGQDQKLPFEYSAEEIEQMKQEAEKVKKREAISAEVQAMFDAGIQLAQEGKYAEAIDEFKKALEKDPEQPNIMGHMADAYSRLDKNEEALEIYKNAVALNPNDAALYTNMGVILSRMGKTAESQEAFKKAAALNPAASAQNFYNIGATMVNNGRAAEAAEAFKQAIAADPNFAEAYYQLGMCLSGNAETMPDAIKALQKYIQIGQKPDQVEVAKQIIAALEQSTKK
jgi:Tfp pilus assembly protein PilF